MPKAFCSHCWQPIEYPDELEGQQVPCPACTRLTVLTAAPAPQVRIPEPQFKASPSATAGAVTTPVSTVASKLAANIETVIVGKRQEILLLLAAAFSEGHVLLEDVPGVAKTMLARSLAQSLGCSFKRIQCTPDLLPNDITGSSVFNPKSSEFEFRPGPIFCQVLLADEINRATPRTQSALLEAMAERQVTVDGKDYPLEPPFLLIATQNPVEHEGTFPLPEAQLDRFFLRLTLGYPGLEGELEMLKRLQAEHPVVRLQAVSSQAELLEGQRYVRQLHVEEAIREYALKIVHGTRIHDGVRLGASPRASMALVRASQAWAALQGYEFVLPDHVKEMAPHVLAHRLLLRPETRLRKASAAMIVQQVIDQVEVPSLQWRA